MRVRKGAGGRSVYEEVEPAALGGGPFCQIKI